MIENIKRMKEAHRVLCDFPFEIEKLQRGYAGRILRIDLDKNEVKILPLTQQMKDLWVGGKGFDLWLMFQEINKDTRWDSPQNPICFSSGPLGGTTSFPGSGKTLVTTISPITQSIMDCNVGGFFGPFLKFSGFDALVILGKAREESIIIIDAVNRKMTIETAPLESIDSHLLSEELTEMLADDELDKRNIAVVSSGSAAQHARMGILNFSFWDWRRKTARLKQAGRGGIGTVFRDKKLKALVVKNRGITPAWRIGESKAAAGITPKKISIQCANDIPEIDAIIEKWGKDPEFVIEMMLTLQERFRHISKTAIERLQEKTGIPQSYLYHIATFHRVFSLEPRGASTVQVCTGSACHARGAARIADCCERELGIKSGQTTPDKKFTLEAAACFGDCNSGPVVKIGKKIYDNVAAGDIAALLKQTGSKKKERGAFRKSPAEVAFFSKPPEIIFRNRDLVNLHKINRSMARGGYKSLKKVLAENNPAGIIDEIGRSGLRGRGGGGFPTGLKWAAAVKAAKEKNEIIYVVCNAAGSHVDRSLIECNPHALIEAMLIGAFAVGASEGFIYTRHDYNLVLKRLEKSIKAARENGFLGTRILGTDFSFNIRIQRGTGDFLCGESTALLAAMSGRAAEPRPKYNHNTEYGFRGKPTIVDNVETWLNIPVIIEKGAGWFAGIGSGAGSQSPRPGSTGTKIFSLSGNIVNAGLVEAPLGIKLREIVEDIGGGVANGRKLKAVQIGGPSGGYLPAGLLDIKIDFDSLREAGTLLGSGAVVVMDDRTCMVDAARIALSFLAAESCGKCTPCREGLYALENTLDRICSGGGRAGDIEFLEETAEMVADTSLCQLGGTAPNPVLSGLRYFRQEYEEHIAGKKCSGGCCKALITYKINDKCTGCTLCVNRCPTAAISGEDKKNHRIDSGKCIKCGICEEVCKFNAVEVE